MPLDSTQIGYEHNSNVCFVPSASIPGMPWFCVYTHPQAEIKTELKLRREGAGVWLPLESVTLANRQRRIRAVFPRYLFMQMTGERPRWGYTIRDVAGEELGSVLRSPAGKPLEVPLPALEVIWSQCAANGVIYPPAPREMQRGDQAKVLDGPFADFRGLCTRTTREKVWLLLTLFGRRSEVGFRRDAVAIA